MEFSPSGGLFQFAAQLGTALAERGHEVHLITGPTPELRSTHPRFTIHAVLPTWHPRDGAAGVGPLQRRLRRGLRAVRLLRAWLVLTHRLLRLAPDAVVWSTLRFSLDAAFVTLLGRLLPRSTAVFVAHEPTPHQYGNTTADKTGRVLDRLMAIAWSSMDVVFVLGEETRRRAIAAWKPTAPVMVIPHGDSTALVRPGGPYSAAATEPVILFFGTWTTYKGVDLLLDAFALLRPELPQARLVLAGGVGSDLDLPTVLRRAEAIGGIDARPRYIDIDELNDLFMAARVVVTPYRRASQSGVAHLAHTFARPVVATRVGDIPAVVCDGETGLLVPPDDVLALKRALMSLLTDARLAAKLGDAGQRRLRSAASWDEVAEQVDLGIAKVRKSP